jgi:hypothetical protein
MKKNTLKQISFSLILSFLFLTGCNQHDRNKENIEKEIIATIKKDGWLFKTEMGCDQLSKYSSEWDVKGIYISKDSLIEIYIRESYEYKKHPRHTGTVNFKKLKSIYPDMFEYLSNKIKNHNYIKFGLLFYDGRYKCENGVNIQKDTIPVMFTNNYENKEYLEIGNTPGP